jgi:3D (Asp-Asp-Asp) domain-containing protein
MRTPARRTVVPAAAGLTGLCAAVLLAPTGTDAARAAPCEEAPGTVVVTDGDQLEETLATAAPGTVVVVDTGGLAGEIRVEGAAGGEGCAPGAPPAPESGDRPAGSVETAYLTGYSLEDNSPAGSRTTSSGRTADGTGTFDDPITLAVGYAGGDEFPVGTVFYVPLVRAYFVVEDRCGACSDPTYAGDYTIDLWVGSDPDMSCMYALTGPHTVVRDAGPGWSVVPRPDELGGNCSRFDDTPTPA